MRKIFTAGVAAALAGLSSAALATGFSGTVYLTSDYVFRGISQSSQDPAFQGSIDFKEDNGFYAGVWGSNVDFNENELLPDPLEVDDGQVEFDIYVGWGGKFPNEKAGWDINLTYFLYPGTDSQLEYDYLELTPALFYDFGTFNINGKIHYSPDFFGLAFDDGFYYEANLGIPLQNNFSLGFHVGHQTLDKETLVPPLPVALEDSYTDYSVALGLAAAGLNFTLAYTDTDLNEKDCLLFAGVGEDVCEGRVVFTVARSL
ncbi:MAG: TorF family putative porin [Nevskiales bacterium]